MRKEILLLIIFIGLFFSCKNTTKNKDVLKEQTPIFSKNFDTIIQEKPVALYWIKNENIEVALTNYGGRIIGLWVPDIHNEMTDVVVGFGSIEDYLKSSAQYFGATIGRVGNRIGKGKFILGNKEYSIPINNGVNSLHGGIKGFHTVVWDAVQTNESTVEFSYFSKDMEEGFPGNLKIKVTYSVTADRSILMKYEARTDKQTIVNLTNHAFFNLNGEGSGNILNHSVKIYADKFTPVDHGLIPTGELRSVKNTPFDFTNDHTIGERINVKNEQLKNGKGYDHNFVLNSDKKEGLKPVARIIGDTSGIIMEVTSEEPGVQFYSGNFQKGENTFKSGGKDELRTSFALETQHFPDAPNQLHFPSIELSPKETYSTISEYRFTTQNN